MGLRPPRRPAGEPPGHRRSLRDARSPGQRYKGSFTAGDNALQAMSASCRMPSAASWLLGALEPNLYRAGQGVLKHGPVGGGLVSGARSTSTREPFRPRCGPRPMPAVERAHRDGRPAATARSGCADCTYPDIGASSGTAHSGGLDTASSTLPNRPFTTARVSSSTRLPIASIWMECARWSAKYTTMARLANNNTSAPLTASRGNSSVRPPADSPTVYRPAAE